MKEKEGIKRHRLQEASGAGRIASESLGCDWGGEKSKNLLERKVGGRAILLGNAGGAGGKEAGC